MSSECCATNCEPKSEVEGLGETVSKWLVWVDRICHPFKRWRERKKIDASRSKHVSLVQEKLRTDNWNNLGIPVPPPPPPTISDVYWALGGRAHYNIGKERKYTRWPVGIETQRNDLGKAFVEPFQVTEILPFDSAYTGRPSVTI